MRTSCAEPCHKRVRQNSTLGNTRETRAKRQHQREGANAGAQIETEQLQLGETTDDSSRIVRIDINVSTSTHTKADSDKVTTRATVLFIASVKPILAFLKDENQLKCEPCPAGDFTVAINGTDGAMLLQCIDCPNGFFAESPGSSSCNACPPGFAANDDHDGCGACPAGLLVCHWPA